MKNMLKSMSIAAMMLLLTGCLCLVFVGCKSVEVERNGQSLATIKAADGSVQVVKDASGNPILLYGGWSVDYFQHWNWQKFDSMEATAGQAALKINNYQSGADSNLNVLVSHSLEGATKLVAAVGEAYVKIAGGGAQADTALSIGQKVYEYFTSIGGDASKATVTSDASTGTISVSDGTTTVDCKDGSCSVVQ